MGFRGLATQTPIESETVSVELSDDRFDTFMMILTLYFDLIFFCKSKRNVQSLRNLGAQIAYFIIYRVDIMCVMC